MAAWGALVLLLAVFRVTALPSSQELVDPENARNDMTRIVSGWEASDGQFPYQLSILLVAANGDVSTCGATLIHNEWALTAAHCTANRVNIIIRGGGVSLDNPQLSFETSTYHNHPLYNAGDTSVQPHDVCVINLNLFVEYNSLIQPIRLQSSADKDKDYTGVRLQASGWGATWTDGNSPVILNWVYLTGESNANCKNAYDGSFIIADSVICASSYNVSSQSTCQGDSGGPLVTEDVDGVLTQVGITSFVHNSGCHTDYPAAFTRPGYYHEWLTEVTGIDFDWKPSRIIPEPERKASEENSEEEQENEN